MKYRLLMERRSPVSFKIDSNNVKIESLKYYKIA
jgi:hypothetical protein